VLFFSQHFLGLAGMPRRSPECSTRFADWNVVASIGAIGFGLSQLLFVYIIIKCARGGARASEHVWDGAYNHGLEWTVPSPAPYHTFDEAPVVK
jgi:cytochrome c oxidase subunit 1